MDGNWWPIDQEIAEQVSGFLFGWTYNNLYPPPSEANERPSSRESSLVGHSGCARTCSGKQAEHKIPECLDAARGNQAMLKPAAHSTPCVASLRCP
jgi:hypothetical protein